jgi:hypothetical protein
MVLPMMGLAFTLTLVGGLGSLVALAEPGRLRWALAAFLMFFSGLGAISLSLLLAFVGQNIFGSDSLGGIGFLLGYAIGALSGGRAAFLVAARRGR